MSERGAPLADAGSRWRHPLKGSLKLRLLAVFLLLALALAAVFLLGMQKALGVGWREAVRPLASDYVDRLAADLGNPPSIERAQALVARLPISVRIEGPKVHWNSHPQKLLYGGFDRSLHERNGWQDGPGLLERQTADGHRIVFGLGSLSWEDRPRYIVWTTLGVLLVLTALAYVYLRRLFRPLDDIRSGALRFGSGEFDRPIAVRRSDELGELAQQVNTMAHDLHQMLEAKRALLLAISHELRSPLTRARLHAELLSDQPEHEASRLALLRDLAEMSGLISDLLESERLAGRHAALEREPTDLLALLREQLASQPEAAGVTLVVAGPAAAPPLMALDRTRLRLLLRNLLDNAVRHSQGASTAPELRLSWDEQQLRLQLRDHGPGVLPQQLAQLAQPFYRADSSRQRATGGVGLGLYLCQLVAQAHGGQLSFELADPGLRVTLQLPLNPVA